MDKEQKRNPRKSCFNCLWEPAWHQVGEGFEGACRCPEGKKLKVLFQDDELQHADGKGKKIAKACSRWASTV